MSQHSTRVQCRGQYEHEFLAVRLRNVQPFEQLLLRILIEKQDAFAPELAQSIDTQPQIGEPGERAVASG